MTVVWICLGRWWWPKISKQIKSPAKKMVSSRCHQVYDVINHYYHLSVAIISSVSVLRFDYHVTTSKIVGLTKL